MKVARAKDNPRQLQLSKSVIAIFQHLLGAAWPGQSRTNRGLDCALVNQNADPDYSSRTHSIQDRTDSAVTYATIGPDVNLSLPAMAEPLTDFGG